MALTIGAGADNGVAGSSGVLTETAKSLAALETVGFTVAATVEVTRVTGLAAAQHWAGHSAASSAAVAHPVADLMLRSLNGSRFACRLWLGCSYPFSERLFTTSPAHCVTVAEVLLLDDARTRRSGCYRATDRRRVIRPRGGS
ncbi:MAG TPA: hypothetical protein VK721_00975 [Solirubrobacteraceae bacterium]|nr:hypothetical protein [Solirubrobacteraceae bacterium]